MEMNLWPIFEGLRQSIPSPLKTALAAAAGTIFGAWLTARSRSKKEIVEDLKAVRTAFAVAVSICNRTMSLKRQHVRPMKARYDQDIETHRRETAAGPTGRSVDIFMDLAVIPRTNFPDDILRKLIFEKSSIGERAAIIAIELFTALENINSTCDSRASLSEEYRKETSLTTEQRLARYLGFSTANGFTDARFRHNMDGLQSYTDDCIFFSKLLADELMLYGRRLRNRNCWKYWLPVGRMRGADWSMAERENLIPSADQYPLWTRVFPVRKKSKLKAFGAWIHEFIFHQSERHRRPSRDENKLQEFLRRGRRRRAKKALLG